MLEFIFGILLVFAAFVLTTWMLAITRKLLWLANPKPYKGRFRHGMVFDDESGLAIHQERLIYDGEE